MERLPLPAPRRTDTLDACAASMTGRKSGSRLLLMRGSILTSESRRASQDDADIHADDEDGQESEYGPGPRAPICDVARGARLRARLVLLRPAPHEPVSVATVFRLTRQAIELGLVGHE